MKKYVLAIDQGTTSSRAILFDYDGKVFYKTQTELDCFYPQDGWVEENAIDIWLSVFNVCYELLAKTNLTYDDIDCVGITNQRETTVIWDKLTGMPVYNAIVWQSRQSADICNKLEDYKDIIKKKTGLVLNPYFSASKIRWILDKIENGQERAEKGELLFGTIDTWLMYKMSKGKIFKTDVTNASRTMLFNINTLEYDDELLKIFNIPRIMLPEVCASSCDFGFASTFKSTLKITGVAGDQQAALFGQTCFEKSMAKSTYGTGCFVLMNIGDVPQESKNGLITTIAWQIGDKVCYALEGSVFISGAVVRWLRDEMKMIKTSEESETHATKVDSDLGVYVVPAFVGLGAPYWDDKCRGAIFGLTRNVTKNHFIRACLNSMALQAKDLIRTMEKDIGSTIIDLTVDGGATANNYLLQYQADILNTSIYLPECLETTAKGAAFLAGLGNKFWKNLEELKGIHRIAKIFNPTFDQERIEEIDRKWLKAIEATRIFK